jgi:hypothetical protein
MISSQHHLAVQRDRIADIQRETRRHPVGAVHPLERRQTLGRLGRWLGRRPADVPVPATQHS